MGSKSSAGKLKICIIGDKNVGKTTFLERY